MSINKPLVIAVDTSTTATKAIIDGAPQAPQRIAEAVLP